MRAFVKLRELLAACERSLIALDLKTQRQFKEVYEAIRALMDALGFTADLEEIS